MTSLAPKPTETNQSYNQLHRAIVSGELLPNERLVEMELAQKFGVGRATVRAALVRLEQDGLVEREPNRGARVRLVTVEEAVEMFEARAVLEGLAMRYAARNASKHEITELQANVDRMAQCLAAGDLLAISDLNADLHTLLLRIANHRTVTRLLERLQAHHIRFQYRMILVPGRAAHSLQEHRAIVNAVANHDPDAAEAAMRQHLAHSAEALRQSSRLTTQW